MGSLEDWRNGTIRTVEDKFWPVELASAMGSALFTLRRGLQVAVQLLSTPDPKNLRRNAVYILFILGVPKVVWDIVRIKKSLGVFTKDEDKEKEKKADAAEEADKKDQKDGKKKADSPEEASDKAGAKQEAKDAKNDKIKKQ